jgi:hypothetical protein
MGTAAYVFGAYVLEKDAVSLEVSADSPAWLLPKPAKLIKFGRIQLPTGRFL